MFRENNIKCFFSTKKDNDGVQIEPLKKERIKVQAEICQLERKCKLCYRQKSQLESEIQFAEIPEIKRRLMRKLKEIDDSTRNAETKINNLSRLLIILDRIIAFYMNHAYYKQWLANSDIMSAWSHGELEQCLKDSTVDKMMINRNIDAMLELLNGEIELLHEASITTQEVATDIK